MKTKYLIIAAALLAAPLLAGLTQPAAATIVLPDSQGDYTVTPQTTTQGNQPTPSNDLANPFSLTSNALSKKSFFTLSPAAGCDSGCVNGTASDVVDVVINLKDSTGGIGTLSTSGTFTAD